ncbi:MAG TPA: hypothetical protein VM532_12130 [Burkholderiales bacterium]|nr:hypothetical protein [Burkholderiales bacterium]
MNTFPLKVSGSITPEARNDAVERNESISYVNPFFSFRFSYTEVSSKGDKTHVQARETRFENGKMTSQTFEGTAGPEVYDDIVTAMQNHFVNQTAFFMKSLSLFLPFSSRKPDGED